VRAAPNKRIIAANVGIEFEDGPVSFHVPRGATLAGILENIDRIGRWHKGQPISVDVRFRVADESGDRCLRLLSLISSPVSQPAARRTLSGALRAKLAASDRSGRPRTK
jgi:hypothetical protein